MTLLSCFGLSSSKSRKQSDQKTGHASSPIDDLNKIGTVQCGKDAARYFAFDPDFRNINHGSYGTFPKPTRDVLRYFQERSEARVDEWIRYEYSKRLDVSRTAAAKYVNAPTETCVLVPNATTGINTVLRNFVYQPGDVIILFATIYGACEKTVTFLTETTPLESRKIEYTYPVSDDFLCQSLEETIADLRRQGKNPKFALFDTIVSMPGVRMPFERLTEICRQQKVLSCIDGAHGIGHIPLDLSKLDPDFFVTNCHKWLDVPRGCALFYVPVRNQSMMRSTLPTSHGFEPLPNEDGDGPPIVNPLPTNGNSHFVSNFAFVGTADNSPFLCVPAALTWRSKLAYREHRGDAAHFAYCRQLARRAGEIVAGHLGTEVLSNADEAAQTKDTLGACNFANVRLPLDVPALIGEEKPDPVAVAKMGAWMYETLVYEYATAIPAMYYGGAWWSRLSAQVYLTEEDFEWAGRTLKEVCKRIEAGEWKESREREDDDEITAAKKKLETQQL